MENLFRRATVDDIHHLVPRLREADRNEIIAAVGLPPAVALPSCFEASRAAWVFGVGDEIVGVVGVQDVAGIPELGWVWMVATDGLDKHGLRFALHCRQFLSVIHTYHPILTNHVDARNETHIKWLRWIGCSFIRRLDKWGAESRPFLEFARFEPSCASGSPPS